MAGLTRRQLYLLNFIKRFSIENEGVAPSFDEMREYLGLVSKSGVHRLVHSLVERGFLEIMPHKARSVSIKMAENRQKIGVDG